MGENCSGLILRTYRGLHKRVKIISKEFVDEGKMFRLIRGKNLKLH